MKFKAVIFDMDGVMIDSEIYWPEVEKNIWPKFGIEYTLEFKKALIGINRKDALAYVKRTYGIEISLEEINSLYNEVAEIVYKEKSSLLPGVKELILSCGKHGLDLAIASSSPLDWIQMVLKRFGLGNYFKVLCSTATMNVPGKPDPAIYNITMQKLGVTSNVTAVLEDSFVGVQSGIASGASVIAVPDNQWSFGDFSKADLVADSLEDKRIYQFLALI